MMANDTVDTNLSKDMHGNYTEHDNCILHINLIQNSKKYIFYMNSEHVGLQSFLLEVAGWHTKIIKMFYRSNYMILE